MTQAERHRQIWHYSDLILEENVKLMLAEGDLWIALVDFKEEGVAFSQSSQV